MLNFKTLQSVTTFTQSAFLCNVMRFTLTAYRGALTRLNSITGVKSYG